MTRTFTPAMSDTDTITAPSKPSIDADTDAAFRAITGTDESLDDGNNGSHDLFSHYVNKEDIVTSALTGAPVRAVCGKKWTPSKSPENLQICPDCKDFYSRMQSGE